MTTELVVVASRVDPVAAAVVARWGTPPATGDHVDGVALRQLGPSALLWHRAGLHIHDESLDERLPEHLRALRPTLVFPSIHRSERGQRCLTVHPLGNPTGDAEVGGTPGLLSPSAPRRMTDALRRLDEAGRPIGLRATYEATHHGPAVGLPAFFAEIGFADDPEPPAEAVKVLAAVLPELGESAEDRVALGIGGGHYAPHFTDLALKRRWAFGHLLSRHSLERLAPGVAEQAWRQTPEASGIIPSRAEDYASGGWKSIGPRLRDGEVPRR